MKILFIIHSLKFGGAERQLVELIKGLNRHLYEVHLICLDNVPEGYTEILSSAGIEIRYFLRSYKYDLRPIFFICRFIQEKQIDVVHTFEHLGSLFGLFAAKLSGRPVVCSAIRNAKDENLMLKISKKIFAKFADILVSNSRAGFASRFSELKPHFRVVYNGVDFSRFQQKNGDMLILKTDLGINKFRNIIGMVASLTKRKDQDTLLEAAPSIIQSCPETSFLFVGDGVRRNALSEKARLLGLKDNVFFLGYRCDIDRLYHIFDIFVLLTNSDVHLEGISNAIIEAMAVGVPVVASLGGGTNEIIKHNVNGLLVLPKSVQKTAEAVIELLKNKQKAKRLADAAKISFREVFSLQRYVKEYEDIYLELNPERR